MKAKRPAAAIIGAGFMGRTHLEALRRLGSVDVTAVASASVEKARTLATAFGVDRVQTDYRAILEDPAIDVVHVCTPNALHLEMCAAALASGKHVICEKPLAITSAEAARLVTLARQSSLRHATNHNLRFYPMVQQMRALRESGQLGEILVVQGTYSQDWLLYDTDWNWRVVSSHSGPSRAMADIGSHWCDMAEHVTGLRITSLCADLQTFHTTRRDAEVDTEDFGSVQFHMGERTRGAFTASQVSAGRKNRLYIEIFGTKGSVAWNAEKPDELWIGSRDSANRLMLKDPVLMEPGARSFADYPAGHSEGYDDTFKQLFRRFYHAVGNPAALPEYPLFDDGLRQLFLLDAELHSNRTRAWVGVPE